MKRCTKLGVYSLAMGGAQLLSDGNYFFLPGVMVLPVNSEASYSMAPAHWDEIVSYAELPGGMGTAEEKMKKRPAIERSRAVLADLLEKIKLENCRVNEGYLKALGLRTQAR